MTTQLRQYEHDDPLKVLEREERNARRRNHGCSICKFSEALERGLVICTRDVKLPEGHTYCPQWLEVE